MARVNHVAVAKNQMIRVWRSKNDPSPYLAMIKNILVQEEQAYALIQPLGHAESENPSIYIHLNTGLWCTLIHSKSKGLSAPKIVVSLGPLWQDWGV